MSPGVAACEQFFGRKNMALVERRDVASSDTWNLEVMFSDREAWLESLAVAESSLADIKAFAGRLGESSTTLAAALRQYLLIAQAVERVYVFAHLRSDEDTTNSAALGDYQRAAKLYTLFAEATSFINPELLELDPTLLQSLVETAELEPYRRMIERVVRYRPHTLSHPEESLLASGSEVFSASSSIFSQLNNADFDFGELEVDGKNTSPFALDVYYLFTPCRPGRSRTSLCPVLSAL
jgi:oligoendopeptidase F